MKPESQPVLSARGMSKHYGPIVACDGVDIDIHAGSLTAIVGDNGAGKTTLLKLLCGAVTPDSGQITLRGTPVRFSGPLDARSKGVEAVYQSLALAPNLCAADNIYLGRERVRRVLGIPFIRRLDERTMYASTAEVITRLKVNIPDLRGVPVGQMSGGQQQCVAIARAAHWASDVLFMDEPTAALGVRESKAVLDLVVSIKEQGVAVVMISHILPHVIELADNVVVMRHGKNAATLTKADLTMDGLVRLIVGIEEG